MHADEHLSVNFEGECEAASVSDARVFGGQVGESFPLRREPACGQVPPDWQGKVMHASCAIGDQLLDRR